MRSRLIVVIALFLFCSSCDEMSSAEGNEDFVIFGEDNVEKGKPKEKIETKKLESIQTRKEGGVYMIPTKVNGIPMEFIIDTGASMVSISKTEAQFLYKSGLLSESDFIGTQNFVLANGEVEEGWVILLKSVQIGDRVVYNVEATIDANISAPLLLGQSVLERFGKVSMDYSTGIMELEY
jgi:clan AA aspartic protease (TIGR02281 family)